MTCLDSDDRKWDEEGVIMSQNKIQGASAILLLGVLMVLCFYSLGQPVLADYFESASALSSAEMYNNHLWLQPLQEDGAPFYPALLQWSQIAGYKLLCVSALGARLVTAIAAVLTLLLLYNAAARVLGERTGLRAALISASSLLFVLMARLASGDMLTGLFLLLNMVLCWNAVEVAIQEKRGANAWLWLGCFCGGLAMLNGGLVLGVIPLSIAFVYLLSIGKLSLLVKKRWALPGLVLLIVPAFVPLVVSAVTASGNPLPAVMVLVHQQLAVIAGIIPEYGTKVLFGLLVLLLGMVPWGCYLGLALTTSSFLHHKHADQRFIRLFVLFSMAVILASPFALIGSESLVVAAVPGAALLLARLFERVDVQYSKRWLAAGWLAVILFTVLTLICALLPYLLKVLPTVFGEIGQKIPLLFTDVDLGYLPYVAAAVLACLTYLLYRGLARKKVHAVFNGLTLASCGLVLVTVILLQPVYDRMIMRPVANLAVEAARCTPENGTILLYNIGSRPSAEFYGKRAVLVKNESDHSMLQGLFDAKRVEVGISTGYFLQRLRNFGVDVKELSREHGYVLFTLE